MGKTTVPGLIKCAFGPSFRLALPPARDVVLRRCIVFLGCWCHQYFVPHANEQMYVSHDPMMVNGGLNCGYARAPAILQMVEAAERGPIDTIDEPDDNGRRTRKFASG